MSDRSKLTVKEAIERAITIPGSHHPKTEKVLIGDLDEYPPEHVKLALQELVNEGKIIAVPEVIYTWNFHPSSN